jgi:hypothetical protein
MIKSSSQKYIDTSKILEHTKSGSQYFSYIVAVSFIGGGKRSIREKTNDL